MMELEAERAQARKEASAQNMNMPFRFYCPVGDTRQVVIVDDIPDFFRYEHCLKNTRTNKWDIFCECINENANCPVCKVAERPSYFAMYLTVIDLTPYENKDGVEVPWSKKLLVVKTSQQKKFTRLHGTHKTLRGMIVELTRDGDKDASIGNDISFVDFMPEDELEEFVTEYTDQKGKVHEIIGYEPFDYETLFPRPTEQQLRAIVGGKAEPGSREDDDHATGRRPARRGRDDWEEEERAPTTRARGRAANTEEEREAEEEAPRTRTRAAPATRASTAAPARTRTRRVEPEEAPEDEEEEAPPPRRAAPAKGARPVTRATRPDPEEEAEEEEEAPSQRSSVATLADRRRQLRR